MIPAVHRPAWIAVIAAAWLATMTSVHAQGNPSDQAHTSPSAAPAHPTTLRGIAELQWQLDNAGATIPVSGIWSEQTEAALKQFQQAAGLPVTGAVGHATKSLLGLSG